MYKHILVPVDLDAADAAAKAMGVARHLARRDGAQLTVISVAPAWPEELARTPSGYEPKLDAYLASARQGMEIDGILKVGGSISGRIIEAIENRKIDLVVMASHNPRITDYLIGSNAAHVVLHSPCSVLVVR